MILPQNHKLRFIIPVKSQPINTREYCFLIGLGVCRHLQQRVQATYSASISLPSLQLAKFIALAREKRFSTLNDAMRMPLASNL